MGIWQLTREQVIRAPRLAGDRNPRQANTEEINKKEIKLTSHFVNNNYMYMYFLHLT